MHSRWLTLTAWACACAALMMTAQTRAATPIAWQTHWKNALFTRAKREHRFVLLDLHAVWCHWCHVMDEKTYSDPRVQALMAKYYVTVSVDADEYPDLTSRYGDWGWPATIVAYAHAAPGQFHAEILLADRELSTAPIHITVVGRNGDQEAQALHRAALRYPADYLQVYWWDPAEGRLPNPEIQYPQLGRAAAFACSGSTCSTPVFEADEIAPAVRAALVP
ncbi:MAG: DUF255 domain-containing protein [Steroidobacteraceae bacterium]